jgi:hypothetical protein
MNKIIAYNIPGTGIGNKMFINALAYIIHLKTGRELITTPIEFFKNTQLCTTIGDIVNPLYTRQYGDHFINIDNICNHDGDIIINSFAQRQEYYTNYRDKLREFFIEATAGIRHNNTALYIRNGDYKDIGVYLGIENYRKILNNVNKDDLTIVVEHIDNDVIALQQEYKAKIQSSTILEDFLFIANAKKIIMSQSTFAWWASFLGDPEEIYIPLSRRNKSLGWWYTDPQKDDVDLFIKNNKSYKIII